MKPSFKRVTFLSALFALSGAFSSCDRSESAKAKLIEDDAKPAALAANGVTPGRDPIQDDPDFRSALAATSRGEILRALAYVREALERFPESAVGFDLLGTTSMDLGFQEEALTAAKRAIALDGTNPKFWFNLAECHRRSGRQAEAQLLYRQIVKLSDTGPYIANAWASIGRSCMDAKDYEGALTAFQKAVTAYPNNQQSWVSIADISVYFLPNRQLASEALAHLRKAVPTKVEEMILEYTEAMRKTNPQMAEWLQSLR